MFTVCITNNGYFSSVAKATKRAPGGGRKPSGEFDQLTSPFSVRMPDDLRKQLETAAKKNRRSAGQELLRRLNDSFSRDYSKNRDPGTRALSFLLAELIDKIQWAAGPHEWQRSTFLSRAVRIGFAKLLKAIEPESEFPRVSPFLAMAESVRKQAKGTAFEKHATRYAKEVTRNWKTPERVGNKAAADILSNLYRGTIPEIEKWSRVLDQTKDERLRNLATFIKTKSERTHYGMQDVMRDLELTPKLKKTGD